MITIAYDIRFISTSFVNMRIWTDSISLPEMRICKIIDIIWRLHFHHIDIYCIELRDQHIFEIGNYHVIDFYLRRIKKRIIIIKNWAMSPKLVLFLTVWIFQQNFSMLKMLSISNFFFDGNISRWMNSRRIYFMILKDQCVDDIEYW